MSLAMWLRAGRDQRQLTLEDVARITKIQQRILEKLESGQLDGLPADVFVKGFVRSFAKCVGLPESEAMDRYGAAKSGHATTIAKALVETMNPTVRLIEPTIIRSEPVVEVVDVAPLVGNVAAVEVIDVAPLVQNIAAVVAPVVSAAPVVEAAPIVVETAPVGEAAASEAPKKKRTRKKATTATTTTATSATATTATATTATATTATADASATTASRTRTPTARTRKKKTTAAPAVEATLADPTAAARDLAALVVDASQCAIDIAPETSTSGAASVASEPTAGDELSTSATDVEPTTPFIRSESCEAAELMVVSADLVELRDAVAIASSLTSEYELEMSFDDSGTVDEVRLAEGSQRISSSEVAFEADDVEVAGTWQPTMPSVTSSSVPWRRPHLPTQTAYVVPTLVIDDADPDSADREREHRVSREHSRLSFLPPILLDREDRSARQGGLTLAVIILLIAATLTLSYLMRRPSPSGDGVTMLDGQSQLYS